MKEYVKRLRDVFGVRFIVLVFFTQCFLKGLVFTVFSQGLFPLIKSLGVDAIQFQVLSALALSPWTVKPLFGVLSDNFAIFGYHKRSWMLIACIVGIAGAFLLSVAVYTPIVISLFVMMIHYEISICDLLVEGKYSELARDNPRVGSDIVTLSNAFQQLGVLISLAFIGPLSDAGLFRVTNLIACAVCVAPIVPIALGWLPEPKVDYIFNKAHFVTNWKVITLVTITGLMAPSMAAITVFASKWIGLLCSVIVILCVVGGGYVAMPHPIIARVALYQTLTALSRVSFSSALDYFFTAAPDCLPNGPNFSNTFYITTTGLIGAAAAFITSFFYQAFLSDWKYRNVLLVTTVLSATGGIFDFIIVKRWNLLIGIPDVIFFIIGDDVIHTIVEMLYWIPSSSMISKVCPKGMEACTYAYLAGVSNFAYMVSSIFGAWLTEWFGIVTVGGAACNWDALPPLILIGHVGVVLLVSIPAAWLIPNIPQRDDLLAESQSPPPEAGDPAGLESENEMAEFD